MTRAVHDNHEDEDGREQSLNDELARFRRFLRCMGILLVVWFGMLYLIVHHDNGLVIAGLVMILLWVVYMCTCICWNLRHYFLQRQKVDTSPDDDDNDGEDADAHEETGGLTLVSKLSNSTTTTMGVFPYSFAETPHKLKQCSQPVMPGIGPTNGTYTAVLSAIYFNKPIRSEGTLRLEFLATHGNGWTIQGESNFGKRTRVIQEGFVNAQGKMYWKTGDSIHRGVLDFGSSCLFDGDFVPMGNQWLPTQGGPVGRIVRLELAKASFYSSSVEMVSLSRQNDNDEEVHKGDEQDDLFS